MAKLDPVVKKETAYVAAWVLAGCMLIQGVCLVAGWWSLPVLLGALLGGVTAKTHIPQVAKTKHTRNVRHA